MKKQLISLAVLFLTTTTYAADNLPAPNSSLQAIDQTVAVINDGVITQSQIDIATKNAVRQIKLHHAKMPDMSTLKDEILNQLIYQKLQLQLAKRNGLTATNTQVTDAIKSIAQQHKISVATLKQKIQENGISYPTYRKEIQKQILITMLQHQALAQDIKVSDTEINQLLSKYKSQKKFAMQYHLIDIVVPLPPAPTSTQSKQAKVEALHIVRLLRQGADIDSIKGAEVNDLGWRTKMDLPDIFLHQLPKMKPGSVIGPLRAPNGYHVIKLMKIKKSSAQLPTRLQAKRMLMEQKFQKALHKWLTKLRKQSYIKIVNPQ